MADTKVDSGSDISAKDLKEKKLLEDKENGKETATNGKENEENGEPEVDDEDDDEVDEEEEEDDVEAGDEEDEEDDDDELEGGTKRPADDDDDDDEDDVDPKKQKNRGRRLMCFPRPRLPAESLPASPPATVFIRRSLRGGRTDSKRNSNNNKVKKDSNMVISK